MSEKNRVMNLSRRVLTINLDPLDSKGKRQSLHIAPRKKSRVLTPPELQSKEIAELLAVKPKSSIKLST